MTNASVNSSSCKMVNQNWLSQFGITNITVKNCQKLFFVIPSLCMKMGGNSKMTNDAMKHKKHLSLQLLGLVDKQRIEGVRN